MASNRKKIAKLWSQIPDIKCKKQCADSCGIIMMSEAERKLIIDTVGYDPFIINEIKIRNATDYHNWDILTCMKCPLLKNGECSQYNIRPAVCRLFGVVNKMKCPFGCVPDKWFSDDKAKRILRELGEIK